MSDQELQEHIKSASERNAWGIKVEFCMVGAVAGIDTVLIDRIDAKSANWNVRQNYIHSQLEVPLQCDQSLRDRSCVCYSTGSNTIWEMNTSTPSIFNSLTPVHNILHENLILHDLSYTLHLHHPKCIPGKVTQLTSPSRDETLQWNQNPGELR